MRRPYKMKRPVGLSDWSKASGAERVAGKQNLRRVSAKEAALKKKGEAHYGKEDRLNRYCTVERKGEGRSDGVQPSIWMGVQPHRQRGRQGYDGWLGSPREIRYGQGRGVSYRDRLHQ